MREINLIDELEYNKHYQEIKELNGVIYRDGDNCIYDVVKLSKTVYTADELVTISEGNIKNVNNVTNSFIKTFEGRGGTTNEQINFAKETAKIVYGGLKDNIVTVIPAPCGFGKSSITLEILKNQIKLYKEKLTTDGIIIVTDRLESLRDTEQELKKLNLGGYTFILEGWNEEVCFNPRIKSSEIKMCYKCPMFGDCKLSTQKYEQKNFPILLITNARLKECGESINRFSTWKDGERTILLIDERPEILDTVKVNKALLNQISTEISNCTYENVEEKTKLENKWNEICNMLETKMQRLRTKYKRFIVSNINNDLICMNDNDFMALWEKYMKKHYGRELEHIHTVLTKGGFYVYEKHCEFITTIQSRNIRNMYSDTFKTLIFDGTAFYDGQYYGMYNNGSVKFLDIENTRLYNNLEINAYMRYKLTKTTFRDKSYLAKACANFVSNRMKKGFNNKAYVVSYSEQSVPLAKNINDTLKHRIVKLSENECHYFGNTKGKNGMQECNIMFQFGWDTMPDYEYVIQWLSIYVDWERTLEYCSSQENAEEMSGNLIVKDRSKEKYKDYIYSSGFAEWEFGYDLLNQFKMFSIVTNFYQEVHRTKLRNYNCTAERIEINVFSQRLIILKMIKQLFSKCSLNIITDEISCFKEGKADNRKNKAKGYDEFMNWFKDWNGELIKVKDIKNICKINDKQWENLKKHEIIKEKLDMISIPKRGYYSR